MKKLVIDLGHGGSDPGAVGQNGTHEADVILAIGKEIDLLLGYVSYLRDRYDIKTTTP